MYKLRYVGGMLSFAVLAVLLLSVVGAQANGTKSSFDMNDRFAPAGDEGGSGHGTAKIAEDGELGYKLRVREKITPVEWA